MPLAVPSPQYPTPAPTAYPLTSTSAAFDVVSTKRYSIQRIAPTVLRVPYDSIATAAAVRAQQWLSSPSVHAPDALHLDDAGHLAVLAGRDSLARHYFAARLATTKMTAVDSAYTLLMAVQSFADTTYPTRLPLAEQYLTQLERLPISSVGLRTYQAHAVLAEAYDAVDQRDHALSHGLSALALVPRLPYLDRVPVYNDVTLSLLYLLVAHHLVEHPRGHARLDSLTTVLQAAMVPPRTLAMENAPVPRVPDRWTDDLRTISNMAALLGTPVSSVQATVFWNVSDREARIGASMGPSPDPQRDGLRASQVLPLHDGIIRLLVFGTITCCVDDVVAVDRLDAQLPSGARAVYVTTTAGYWMNVPQTPAQEVARLRAAYLETLNIHIPIALWVGEKQPTSSGGMVPAPSPNVTTFHVPSSAHGVSWTSYAVIVDGQGIVRRVFYHPGRPFDRADEARAMAVIATLRQTPRQTSQ